MSSLAEYQQQLYRLLIMMVTILYHIYISYIFIIGYFAFILLYLSRVYFVITLIEISPCCKWYVYSLLASTKLFTYCKNYGIFILNNVASFWNCSKCKNNNKKRIIIYKLRNVLKVCNRLCKDIVQMHVDAAIISKL